MTLTTSCVAQKHLYFSHSNNEIFCYVNQNKPNLHSVFRFKKDSICSLTPQYSTKQQTMLLMVGCKNGDSFILNTVNREISRADISFESNLYLTHSQQFYNGPEKWQFYGTKLGKKILFSTHQPNRGNPNQNQSRSQSGGKPQDQATKRHWITRKLPCGDLFVNFSIEGDYIVIAGLEKLIIMQLSKWLRSDDIDPFLMPIEDQRQENQHIQFLKAGHDDTYFLHSSERHLTVYKIK